MIVGIRPEALAVSGAAEGTSGVDGGRSEDAFGAGGALAVDVGLVEPLGSEQLVHFTLDAPAVREDDVAARAGRAGEVAGVSGVGGAGRDLVGEGGMLATPVANGVAVTPPRAPVRAGSRAVFSVDVDALHFFDPDTHRAIAR